MSDNNAYENDSYNDPNVTVVGSENGLPAGCMYAIFSLATIALIVVGSIGMGNPEYFLEMLSILHIEHSLSVSEVGLFSMFVSLLGFGVCVFGLNYYDNSR